MRMHGDTKIIIVGAGAAGLLAARELAKAGKSVRILEARDRIGGRIFPLDEAEFGYPAQGGAEFVHGEAPITRGIMQEAGLTFVPEEGETWCVRNDELLLSQFVEPHEMLKEKLAALTEDIPIAQFLAENFNDEQDKIFKDSILKTVEGYDAADPNLTSTFALRNEWLCNDLGLSEGKIKEGYRAFLDFLEGECKKYGVEIQLATRVTKVHRNGALVSVLAEHGQEGLPRQYVAQKIIVTVPLPVLKNIDFDPECAEHLEAAAKIGFGNVIRMVFQFKERWWLNGRGKDLQNMTFLLTDEKVRTWWTQYPESNPILVGWIAGPEAATYKNASSEELLDVALTSLSNIFQIPKGTLADRIVVSKIVNWPADPYAQGSYSYTAVATKDAAQKLAEPIADAIFFAGEALYLADPAITATVEGALGSGLEVAQRILKK